MLNDAKCHWSQPFQEPNRGSCRKSIKSTRIFKRWKWIAFSAARRWLKLSEGHFHPAFIGATALQLRQCAHCRPQTKSSSRLWNWHSWQLQPWPMRLHGERREDMAIYLHPVHIILRDFQWAVIRSRTIRVVTEPLGLWLNLTTRYHTMLGELFFISFYDFFMSCLPSLTAGAMVSQPSTWGRWPWVLPQPWELCADETPGWSEGIVKAVCQVEGLHEVKAVKLLATQGEQRWVIETGNWVQHTWVSCDSIVSCAFVVTESHWAVFGWSWAQILPAGSIMGLVPTWKLF